jgi:hypothetical protein
VSSPSEQALLNDTQVTGTITCPIWPTVHSKNMTNTGASTIIYLQQLKASYSVFMYFQIICCSHEQERVNSVQSVVLELVLSCQPLPIRASQRHSREQHRVE